MTLLSMSVASKLGGAPALPIGDLLPVSSVDDNRIQIRNIEGLGPVKAEFQTAPFALSRGVFFQGSSTGSRNIVLTLGLNPRLSELEWMSDLRHQVYRYFIPEIQVTLTFHSHDMEDVYIDGVVESIEPNMFTQDPEMQISIICSRPDFIGDETREASGDVQTAGGFSENTTEIEYTGTISAGFELEVSYDGSYDGPVRFTNENGYFHDNLLVVKTLINPDKHLRLVTIPTRRRVQTRDMSSDVLSNLLGRVRKTATWPILFPGINNFKAKSHQTSMVWNMIYWNRYGGI